jgi:RNA polymerase sigma factor (sigma-70 family)
LNELILNQLVSEYLGLREELLRFLTARLGDQAAAEDVYQELFMRLRGIHPDGGIENPRGFICRSAYNLANEFARANQRRSKRDRAWTDLTGHKVGMDSISDTPSPDDVIDAKRRLGILVDALDDLTPRCREIFMLRHARGLSHREVAGELGLSIKAVEKQMTTALRHLAIKLGFTKSRNRQ